MRCVLRLIALAVLTAGPAAAQTPMGKMQRFELAAQREETFVDRRQLDNPEHQRQTEVLKVFLFATGKKAVQPSDSTPVWLYARTGDVSHSWQLPWRPAGGPAYTRMEVLLCENGDQLKLQAYTNATDSLPLMWKVSTEQVVLGNGGTMKSSLPDVSYRRYQWPEEAVEVDLDVQTEKSPDVCASLVISRSCDTKPYRMLETADSRHIQRITFAKSVKMTVTKDWAPDGFWVYLVPEYDNTRCVSTAGRDRDHLPPGTKTVRVFTQPRAYSGGEQPAAPQVDLPQQLPTGQRVSAAGLDDAWAEQNTPASSCPAQQEQLSQLQQQLQQQQQFYAQQCPDSD